MKTTRLFFMAALALMIAACSNDDNDFAQQPQKAEGITITAQLAPKSDGAISRAVADNGDNKITVTWAKEEHIAILYEVGSTKYAADAKITEVDGTTGVATIEFTVQYGTPDNTACTLVYPLSAAKDDNSGVKDYATLLAAQDGTLNANLDVRVGAGTIQTTTPGLTVTTQPAAQFAIFKLTMKDIDGSADVSASSVVISDQSGTVTTFTPASGYDKVMYVALPTTATTLKFLVTSGTSGSTKYFNMASDLSLETKFYPSTIKLATVGNVIASNGKCYKNNAATPDGNTAVAMITYLGNDAETNTTYRNGLALALTDASSGARWCSQSSVTCLANQYNTSSTAITDMAGIANTNALLANTSHKHEAANLARYNKGATNPTGTSAWFLPTVGQLYKMVIAVGNYNYDTLRSSFSSVGGTNMESQEYWSSTEVEAYRAWRYPYAGSSSDRPYKGYSTNMKVRACLAF